MLAVPLATCCERPIPKMLWIEHIRTNRDVLGEADARHCQPPGAWRIVVHDLSPFDGPSVPPKCAYVLGVDLNRSESRCRALRFRVSDKGQRHTLPPAGRVCPSILEKRVS